MRVNFVPHAYAPAPLHAKKVFILKATLGGVSVVSAILALYYIILRGGVRYDALVKYDAKG